MGTNDTLLAAHPIMDCGGGDKKVAKNAYLKT
jgi:hypothetical protein